MRSVISGEREGRGGVDDVEGVDNVQLMERRRGSRRGSRRRQGEVKARAARARRTRLLVNTGKSSNDGIRRWDLAALQL